MPNTFLGVSTDLIRDFAHWRSFLALFWILWGSTYQFRTHPDFQKEPIPEKLEQLPTPRDTSRVNVDYFKGGDLWESKLKLWVRTVQSWSLAYGKDDYNVPVEYMDNRLFSAEWPEVLLTGSNVSAIVAGKATYALLRAIDTGQEKYKEEYYKYLNLTQWWIERAFTERGAPYEGLLYGSFGARPVALLSYIQKIHGLSPVVQNTRLEKFPEYIKKLAVGQGEFPEVGDSKTEEIDTFLLAYLNAQEALEMTGRPYEYQLLLFGNSKKDVSLRYFPNEQKRWYDPELNQLIVKSPNFMLVVDGGGNFGSGSLHAGRKAGSHAIFHGDEFLVRDEAYTNAIRDYKTYDSDVFSAPTDAKFTERADITVGENSIIVDGWNWQLEFSEKI